MNTQNILTRVKEINAALEDLSLAPIIIGEVVSREEIASVERKLGIEFCNDYLEFLQSVGCLHTNMKNVNGISYFAGGVDASVLTETERFTSEVAGDSKPGVILLDDVDDGEWFVCLDNNTSKIVYFDPFSEKWVERGESLEELLSYILDLKDWLINRERK